MKIVNHFILCYSIIKWLSYVYLLRQIISLINTDKVLAEPWSLIGCLSHAKWQREQYIWVNNYMKSIWKDSFNPIITSVTLYIHIFYATFQSKENHEFFHITHILIWVHSYLYSSTSDILYSLCFIKLRQEAL